MSITITQVQAIAILAGFGFDLAPEEVLLPTTTVPDTTTTTAAPAKVKAMSGWEARNLRHDNPLLAGLTKKQIQALDSDRTPTGFVKARVALDTAIKSGDKARIAEAAERVAAFNK